MGSWGNQVVVSRVALALTAGALAALCLPASAGAATLTVNTNDFSSTSQCTLFEAILAANLNQNWGSCDGTGAYGDDTIDITSTGTMLLPNSQYGLPTIESNLTLTEPGTDALKIQRENGPNAFRVLVIQSNRTVSISDLTLSNGKVTQVGPGGAGIMNFGDLTLDRVAVVDNHVDVQSADVNAAPNGGGIASYGPLTMTRTTVADNTLTSSQTAPTGQHGASVNGGGVWSDASLTVERSTISANTATASAATSGPIGLVNALGGGVVANGPTDINLSTITGNRVAASADSSPGAAQSGLLFARGGGIHSANQTTVTSSTVASNGNAPASSAPVAGANIWAEGTETARNTIIAYPVGAPNCEQAFETDGGGNLVFPVASAPAPPTCGLAPVTEDPLLESLADNGGPTATRAIPLGSPAVDAGVNSGESSDQRELTRPVNRPDVANSNASASAYDIGAFELQADTVPPDTTIDSFHLNARRGKATFGFSSTEADSTFKCSMDGSAFKPCSSPREYRHLKKGRHRFEVRAVDPSGNPDPDPAKKRFRVTR